jgi:RNA methyltransferase, TrmH family
MLVKSQVKYIQSLGQKKFRDQEGVFIAEGPKLVGELLEAPDIHPVQVFALHAWLESQGRKLTATAAAGIVEVKDTELERISSLATPNQVLAIFRKPSFPAPEFGHTVTVLLDGMQDPGNLGTIIRISDWFGIRQVVCSKDSVDAFNTKTIQSTMGSISRVQVLYEDLESLIRQQLQLGLPAYAAALEGQSIHAIGPIGRGMIVIGNESKGISRNLLDLIPHHITIPRTGEAESLNAAVATGIILSHLVSF